MSANMPREVGSLICEKALEGPGGIATALSLTLVSQTLKAWQVRTSILPAE